MNGFEAEKYKRDINRLGINAVQTKETEDFFLALAKLKSAFINGYTLYLYDVYKLEIGKDDDEKQAKIDSSLDFALNNYERIVENKVNGYDGSLSHDSDVPFFVYLINDFVIGSKKQIKRDEMSANFGFCSKIINDRDAVLLKKMSSYYDSMDSHRNFIHEASVILEESEKKLEKIWSAYKSVSFVSLDMDFDEESDELSLVDIVADESSEIEKNAFSEDSETVKKLLLMNKVYHDSFMEKHKIAFPPYFTNEMINGWVKERKKTNVSFADTVRTEWDYINFPYKRTLYREADYLCIREYVYDWFENVKREILGREIAERIGMSASHYKKVCDQAKGIIQKYEEM